MAGYSGTPLSKKLGIKNGSTVVLVGAPDGFELELAPLPEEVTVRRRLSGQNLDVIVLFVSARAELERRFPGAAKSLQPAGGLWVAWPKRASGVPIDLTENVVREVGLATGLVDNKVCAISDVWSGLRFVIRLIDRRRG
ncbi:MAG TPA: DUF3052 domain-containing protein [Acidimicrobiales bacterium]|nr:DUF3052 domain-containing protein [Acidimicrobiales bacterium]